MCRGYRQFTSTVTVTVTRQPTVSTITIWYDACTCCDVTAGNQSEHPTTDQWPQHPTDGIISWWWFLARDVIYTSRNDVSVRLSVTEVHWRIIANLGFKFRSHFTAHCGRRATAVLLAGGSSRAMLASARLFCIVFTLAAARVRNVIMSMSVSLYVCQSVQSHNTKTTRPNFTKFLYTRSLASCGGATIRCVLPVLWMTSCFYTMALWRVMYKPIPERRYNMTSITAKIPTKFCSTIKSSK